MASGAGDSGHMQGHQTCPRHPRLHRCSTQPCVVVLLPISWSVGCAAEAQTPGKSPSLQSLPLMFSPCMLVEGKCSKKMLFFLKINVQHSAKCLWTSDNLAWIFFGLSCLGPYLSSSGILLIALRAETLLGPCFSKYARTLDVISLQVKDGKAAIFYQNHWAEDLKTFVTTDWNTTCLILAI